MADDKLLPAANETKITSGTALWKAKGQDAFVLTEQEKIAKTLGVALDRVTFTYAKESRGDQDGTTMYGSK